MRAIFMLQNYVRAGHFQAKWPQKTKSRWTNLKQRDILGRRGQDAQTSVWLYMINFYINHVYAMRFRSTLATHQSIFRGLPQLAARETPSEDKAFRIAANSLQGSGSRG